MAEIMLFVLVGATVDLHYAASAGAAAVVLIFGVLLFEWLVSGVVCLAQPSRKRATVLHVCLYAKGNSTGSYRRNAACDGTFLWKYCFDSGCAINLDHCTASFLIDGTYKKLLMK